MSNDEYEVGYGKPPKESQFKKGQSGNPKGRPKKRRITLSEFDQMYMEVAGEMVSVKTSKGLEEISVIKAILKQQAHKAMNGNNRAASIFLAEIKRSAADFERDAQKVMTMKAEQEIERWNKMFDFNLSDVTRNLGDLTFRFIQKKYWRLFLGENTLPYVLLEPKTDADWERHLILVRSAMKDEKKKQRRKAKIVEKKQEQEIQRLIGLNQNDERV
jgi:hypothetical protein